MERRMLRDPPRGSNARSPVRLLMQEACHIGDDRPKAAWQRADSRIS